jgi:hypothetical protein
VGPIFTCCVRFLRHNESPTPLLTPELDDAELGRVRKQLQSSAGLGYAEIRAYQVEQVIRKAEADWGRRTHRVMVLAEHADAFLAQFWRRRQPDSADAILFHSQVELVHGRRQGTLANPEDLISSCTQAAELQPEDPLPWVVLLGALRLLRRRPREIHAAWKEATARDRWNREAHLHVLGYLSPEECGSHTETLAFLDHILSTAPPDSACASMELITMVERHHAAASAGSITALTADRLWAFPPAVDALERALAHWLQPGFLRHASALADLNLLAYALMRAGHAHDAVRVFRLIGSTVTPWPWNLDGDPLEQYESWRARAQRRATE